ncbi:MAG: hypothetical protein JWR55_1415 [Aeromicrobium sp.]|nr:hypothetical protein [Aeromicrobium sp.]
MISATAVVVIASTMLGIFTDDGNPQRSTDAAGVTGPSRTPPAAAPMPAPAASPAPAVVTATTPAPVVVPSRGSGTFKLAPGDTPRVGSGRLVTYRVEVEKDLPVRSAEFAKAVDATLTDRRGWTAAGSYAFQRTGTADLRVVLATPSTTDRLCAPLQTRGKVSCRMGNDVVINARRWVYGADSYKGELAKYRQYVINHEVGHSLGLGHESCPEPGADAPVMLQQTLGLQGCEANPWP